MKGEQKERRLHPRLEHKLPIKIAANGYDFETTSQNISCLGAYCRIAKYVPPFTRIAVKLELPIVAKRDCKDVSVQCSGVIVRSEDDPTGGFNIAIFFNAIKESQRKIISKYVAQFLPQESLCLKKN